MEKTAKHFQWTIFKKILLKGRSQTMLIKCGPLLTTYLYPLLTLVMRENMHTVDISNTKRPLLMSDDFQ